MHLLHQNVLFFNDQILHLKNVRGSFCYNRQIKAINHASLKKRILFSLQAYMQNVFQFCIIVVPMMFSLSVFNVITDSILTKSVPSSDTGEKNPHNADISCILISN